MPPRRPARRSGRPRLPAFSSFARFAKASAKPRRRRRSLTEHRPESSSEKFVQSKKRDVRESSENSLDNDEDIIFADFEFFDPNPSDFHGVKNLLRTYLDSKQWDLSDFVDMILGQPTVGTVVRIDGDDGDNLFAVITALNMDRYKDHKCIMELKEFLLQICHDNDVRTCLKTILQERAQDVGLLVSQRMINLPIELLPPLYDALFDEISWATEDEPTEELRKSFCFKYYLIVTRFYKKKTGQSNRMRNDQNEESVIYVKIEDEIFHKLCSWSFTFPTEQIVANESTGTS
ncbi:BCCIP-like protein [Nymphaea thermarum]|nr:BCCIP-like protein [Nymphaea thermarum]